MKHAKLFSIIFAILTISCEQVSVSSDFFERIPEQKSKDMYGDAVPASLCLNRRPGEIIGSGENPLKNNDKQMLIKKAVLRFEVKNYNDTRERIGKLVENQGAYISSEQEIKTEYQLTNTMQIRVIAGKFDRIMDSLAIQAKNLDEKKITVEDVTEEFVDVNARLNAKKSLETRYLEILKKTQTVKEILEVEQYLGQVRMEIERAEGRLKYLENQVSYSTVDLTFYHQIAFVPQARTGFLTRLSSSFLNGWRGLNEFFLQLVSAWPVIMIISFIIVLSVRFVKRLRQKAASEKIAKTDE